MEGICVCGKKARANTGGKCLDCALEAIRNGELADRPGPPAAAKRAAAPEKKEEAMKAEEKSPAKPEMVCGRCGEPAREKYFRRARMRCNSCAITEDKAKRMGKPVPPLKNPRPISTASPSAAMPRAAAKRCGGGSMREARKGGEARRITVDFSDYPDLHEELLAAALEEMRPPEMQVLYYLAERVKSQEG